MVDIDSVPSCGQENDYRRAQPSSSGSGEEIKLLERKVDNLRAELRDAEQRLRAAKITATGVAVGDIVRHSRNKKLFRVARVEPHSHSTWLMGNPQRADGTFGKAERHLFEEWERVES